VLIVVVILFIVGAFSASQAYRWRAPRELTPRDVTDITIAIRQETAAPVLSMTPNRDGTVGVFAGRNDESGGELFRVKKTRETWRVVHRTLLF
jgi:hypothetical protein